MCRVREINFHAGIRDIFDIFNNKCDVRSGMIPY